MENCFHCGDECRATPIIHYYKHFCCNGCKTVFDIINENELSYYYELEGTPGSTPYIQEGKFDFLGNKQIASQFLEFDELDTQIVSLQIPTIHCSSCIWVLENLDKLNPAIRASQVNFPEKTVRITFSSKETTLQKLVILLAKIGYEPYMSLDDASIKKKPNINKGLIYKLGVAGFAFGNIMFLSFPEYFEVNEFWLERFKHTFRWLAFVFAIPVVVYSARDYFLSAYKGLRSGILNMDVPIAIGISVLFVRSTVEIAMGLGTGFLDSMAGLVFFLLLGKFFQQKTYAFLSFERDYRSYFPIAVTRLVKKGIATTEEQTQVYELEKGDRILIRNSELLPVDATLINGKALIDYSFVTGEAEPITKKSGDQLFAGGRQQAGAIEVEVLKPVKQSYLTQLWSNEIFDKNNQSLFESLTDRISKRFTLSILSIAMIATTIWLFIDSSKALNVFTAVLIVACPCAIALAAPFTLGNLLRIFGYHKLYMKDSVSIERLARVDTVVFDKTGTLTTSTKNTIAYEGVILTKEEKSMLTNTLRASNHPLSRSLYATLDNNDIKTLDDFKEDVGQGITGTINNHKIKIGSYGYTDSNQKRRERQTRNKTAIHISTDDEYKGYYIFFNDYRNGVKEVFDKLGKNHKIIILSGDNDGEKDYLKTLLPENATLLFNQRPEDKLNYIKEQQEQGKNVLMIGDGLNDAGALAQSNVGISISENVNVFSPACDGILDASRFKDITRFLSLSKKGIKVIEHAFVFSLFYNMVGLLFAITGNLEPVVAAILMPLSSISIVVFTTMATFFLGRELKNETAPS